VNANLCQQKSVGAGAGEKRLEPESSPPRIINNSASVYSKPPSDAKKMKTTNPYDQYP